MKETELLVACKTLWDNNPSVTALVLGGLHEGRVGGAELPPGSAGQVYASQRVQLLDPIEWNSGPWSLQRYRLDIMVFSAPGSGAVNAGQIGMAIDFMLERSRRADLEVFGCETVDLVRVAGSLAEDPAVKEATDVYVWGGMWEVLLYVPRKVAVGY